MSTAPFREQHTGSLAEPPVEAFAGAYDRDGTPAAPPERVTAERLLLGLQVAAERDGIGRHVWPDGGQLIVFNQGPGEFLHYYLHPGLSHEETVTLVAGKAVGG